MSYLWCHWHLAIIQLYLQPMKLASKISIKMSGKIKRRIFLGNFGIVMILTPTNEFKGPPLGRPGDRLNIKMSSYKQKNSHYKCKSASLQSYLLSYSYNGNSHTWGDIYLDGTRGPHETRYLRAFLIPANRGSLLSAVGNIILLRFPVMK